MKHQLNLVVSKRNQDIDILFETNTKYTEIYKRQNLSGKKALESRAVL